MNTLNKPNLLDSDESHSEKFTSQCILIESDCDSCKHLSKVSARLCLAFPHGIPKPIFFGKVSHKTPYPGDDGITYEKA